MKQTPNEYAEMLIKQYYIPILGEEASVKFAINDVNNTIEALGTGAYNIKKRIFYKTVLNILKSKL